MTDKTDDVHGFSMSKVAGVVFPIPLQFINRIFDKKRNVFARYLPHPTFARLAPRSRLFLYASHGQKEIVGEALIRKIEFLTPDELLKKYGEKVFLSRDELMNYTSQRPSRTTSKKMLVLILSKPRKYLKGIRYSGHMTMAGEYLTEDKYKALSEEIEEAYKQQS